MPSKSNTATSFYQNSIKIDYLHSFGVISDKTVFWVQIHIAFYVLEIGCFFDNSGICSSLKNSQRSRRVGQIVCRRWTYWTAFSWYFHEEELQ